MCSERHCEETAIGKAEHLAPPVIVIFRIDLYHAIGRITDIHHSIYRHMIRQCHIQRVWFSVMMVQSKHVSMCDYYDEYEKNE